LPHHIGNASAGARLNSTMIGINVPIRIGGALVMPGDVVLGRDGGLGHRAIARRRSGRSSLRLGGYAADAEGRAQNPRQQHE